MTTKNNKVKKQRLYTLIGLFIGFISLLFTIYDWRFS